MMGKKKNKAPVAPPAPPKPPGMLLRENGVLFLSGCFDEDNIMPLVTAIHEMNLEENKPAEIKLYINSEGGEVRYCWQLIDAMRTSEIPVTTIATGLAASCGVITLMAGHKRIVCHNAQVMSHTYSSGSAGKEAELEARRKSHEMMSASIIAHYEKFTGYGEKYIRKHLLKQTDVWLTPEECVKYRIADEVLETY